MEDTKTKEFIDFLKEKIDEYCNDKKCYEMFWDYRDNLDPETIYNAYENYKKDGYEGILDYLENEILELNLEVENEFFDNLKKDIMNTENPNIIEEYKKTDDFVLDLYNAGYNGLDTNIEELLQNSQFHVNIMFGTEAEQNSDMSSIINNFGSWKLPDIDYIQKEDFDNALVYFIHQQGHSLKEVYDCLYENSNGFSNYQTLPFVKSVVNDIVNNSSDAMSELTVLVKLKGNELITFIDELDKGKKNFVFEKETEIGIFNEWAGCGGLLEMEMDKPFIVPKNMVTSFQIEGMKCDFGYTVDQVYGLIGSCWKETLSYTEEEPKLYEENLNEVLDYLKELNEKLVNIEDDFEEMSM